MKHLVFFCDLSILTFTLKRYECRIHRPMLVNLKLNSPALVVDEATGVCLCHQEVPYNCEVGPQEKLHRDLGCISPLKKCINPSLRRTQLTVSENGFQKYSNYTSALRLCEFISVYTTPWTFGHFETALPPLCWVKPVTTHCLSTILIKPH